MCEVQLRDAERRVIENVEGLHSKLRPQPLGDLVLPEKRHIEVRQRISANLMPAPRFPAERGRKQRKSVGK